MNQDSQIKTQDIQNPRITNQDPTHSRFKKQDYLTHSQECHKNQDSTQTLKNKDSRIKTHKSRLNQHTQDLILKTQELRLFKIFKSQKSRINTFN